MALSQLIRNLRAACLAFCMAAPLSAQTFELSLEEGRVAARQAALSGQFTLARDFALALTDADPNDREALIVLAAVQPQLGAARDGRTAGARAYRLSTTDAQRYEAARLTALAAANEDRFTLSQLWLRRAAVNAPDEQAFEQTQADYRSIRALNPWSVTLGFSVAPSSNVNGGSETELNVIDGLPFVGVLSGDAQALSGVTATGDLRLSYAVARDPEYRTSLTARAYARNVWLSDEARTIAPDSRNSDFGSQVLEFGVLHQQRFANANVTARAIVGATWFGGDASAGYLRTTLGYSAALNPQTSYSVTAELEQTYAPAPWTPYNQSGTLTGGLSYVTQGGDRLSGQLSFDAQASDNLNERYETLTAAMSYSWADPLGPVQLSVSAGLSLSHYRDYTIIFAVPDGRRDTRTFVNVQAVFPEINYAGFVPVVTFGVQDTDSNVSRFERNEYSLNIGIRSSF